MAFTTTELITALKTKGMIPTSQSTFSSANMLSLADDEMRTGIVPLIMSVRENYFQTSADTPLVDGTSRYRINPRAIGMKLQDLLLVDPSGQESSLELIAPEDRATREGFFFQGSDLELRPTPSGKTGWSLRQVFFRRPGTLVLPSACGAITAINTALKQVTISSTPSTFTTSVLFDFVQATPGFDTLGQDLVVTDVTSNVITFSATLPTALAVGDYVALAGESPIPQVPSEFHSILSLKTAATILRSLGHDKEASAHGKHIEKLERAALILINPRVDGEAKRVLSTHGVLRPNGSQHPFFRY